MNFFSCNCTNIEQELDINNSNLYIKKIILHSMDQDKVISLSIELNVILQGFKLNRQKDCLYLLNLKKFKEDIHYTLTKLNPQFQIPLNNQDDSIQEFNLNLNLNIYEGCYKLLYLQQRDSYFQKHDYIYGEWEIMGSTEEIKIELIQNKNNKHNHQIRILMYSISKTPKLQRKR
ncbi:unnamed protein product [Paramecium sonneborni]|uniref:Uncharacterized protein n=1 Tax=Paramecium sonneborni TaxID=65129 RepID=A0A8S1QCU2_9CILI|nr:unnamed protein product [Paramecium sonneborni]CAD8113661.1 unnamed protein product [Paramecium sonneborni]